MMAASALAGRRIVVTRPSHLASELLARLAAAGAETLLLPVLSIVPASVAALAHARGHFQHLDSFDILIFISRNAVEYGLPLLRQSGGRIGAQQLLAVGQGSARSLEEAGLQAPLYPRGGSASDGLLELPVLQSERVRGRRVCIVRGEGGRELLADTLRQRGAEVSYAEVYQRVPAEGDPTPLLEALRADKVDCIIITSGEGLGNLSAMITADLQAVFRRTPLLVPGERLRQLAQQQGHSHVWMAPGADDETLMQVLRQRFVRQG